MLSGITTISDVREILDLPLASFCRPDYEAGLRDFKIRLANYEKVASLLSSSCYWSDSLW